MESRFLPELLGGEASVIEEYQSPDPEDSTSMPSFETTIPLEEMNKTAEEEGLTGWLGWQNKRRERNRATTQTQTLPKESNHSHHWRITEANGPISDGTCKECGAHREFKNWLAESDYLTSGEYRQ